MDLESGSTREELYWKRPAALHAMAIQSTALFGAQTTLPIEKDMRWRMES